MLNRRLQNHLLLLHRLDSLVDSPCPVVKQEARRRGGGAEEQGRCSGQMEGLHKQINEQGRGDMCSISSVEGSHVYAWDKGREVLSLG